MSTAHEELLNRIPQHRLADAVRDACKRMLKVGQDFRTLAAKINVDRNLTVEGKAAKLRAELSQTYGPRLRNGRRLMHEIKARTDALRTSILPKTDAANVADALARQEIRAWLRSLDAADRNQAVLGEDDGIAVAVLTGPAALSGLSKEVEAKVRKLYHERHFAQQSREIEVLEELAMVVDTAAKLARADLAIGGGLDAREFAMLMKPVDEGRGAVWLKHSRDAQGTETIIVVPIDGGPARAATAKEIEEGMFFENADEWARVNGHPNFAAFRAAEPDAA